ncbi:MAG: hypothetical protein M5U28_02375 [Sandaracinaceae bacterium]|nr:hypothetical protein [Sandaracinaceae bacterium]
MLDTPVECTAWEGFGYSLCTTAPPDELVVTGDVTYDTDDQEIDDGSGPVPLPGVILPDGGLLLVFSRVAVEEGGRLRVVGRRPLVIASTTRIDVDGEIDASSGRGRGRGAGANDAAHCADHAARGGAPDPASNSAGGGGRRRLRRSRRRRRARQRSGGRHLGRARRRRDRRAAVRGVRRLSRRGGGGTNTPGNGGGGGDGGGGIGLVAGRGILVRGVVHAGGAGGGTETRRGRTRAAAAEAPEGSWASGSRRDPLRLRHPRGQRRRGRRGLGRVRKLRGRHTDRHRRGRRAGRSRRSRRRGLGRSTPEGEAGNPGGEGGGGGGGGAGLVVVRTPLFDDRGALASPPITGP